jgi:branched-chain amino acid transport system ATP-binding protein
MSLLEVERLTRRFGGLAAVAEVSFAVEEGEIVGLIGPNGAGKTTLFAVLAGALAPSGGRIRFDGRDVTGWASQKAARAGVGRTYQIVRTFRSMTTFENVLVGAYLRSASPRAARMRAMAVLERVGLERVAYEPGVNLPLALKRRLELARALATAPRLLLLDEVMSGLTPVEAAQAVELTRSLNADGLTIILVEHVMEVVMPLSARVVVLDHGAKIAEGPPAAVSRDAAVIEAYLGEPLEGKPRAGSGAG